MGDTPLWQNLIWRNAGLKAVSVMLAVFVWYSTNLVEQDAERIVEVPLVMRQTPRNLVVTDWPRDRVHVTVRGPRPLLDGVDETRSRLVLRLHSLEAGENWMDLKAGRFEPELPERLEVVRLEPGRVLVQAKGLKKRSLPVHPTLTGAPSFGFRIRTTEATPGRVEVSGPIEDLRGLEEVKSVPVDVGGQETSFQHQALLEWVGDFVTFVPDRVTVSVELEEIMITREFRSVAVRVIGPEGARLEPPNVALTLRGPQRILHDYKLPAGAAYVDVGALGAGDHQVEVMVNVPEAVEIVTREPDIHRVVIQEGAES